MAKEDRENLGAMVKELVADGAKIDTNLDNTEYYLWHENGRLQTIRIGDDESTNDYGVTEVNVKGITTLKHLGIVFLGWLIQ